VPHPLLFIVLTIAFAMLPFGAWATFTTAALILLFHGGSLLVAVGLFGFGAAVMLIGDNFIQPSLIASTTQLPFLLGLIAILGGLQSFGLVGLFLGPVIVASLLTVWRERVAIGVTDTEQVFALLFCARQEFRFGNRLSAILQATLPLPRQALPRPRSAKFGSCMPLPASDACATRNKLQ
jgi:AI-2E family transporter